MTLLGILVTLNLASGQVDRQVNHLMKSSFHGKLPIGYYLFFRIGLAKDVLVQNAFVMMSRVLLEYLAFQVFEVLTEFQVTLVQKDQLVPREKRE